jgi:hypothetical protein
MGRRFFSLKGSRLPLNEIAGADSIESKRRYLVRSKKSIFEVISALHRGNFFLECPQIFSEFNKLMLRHL